MRTLGLTPIATVSSVVNDVILGGIRLAGTPSFGRGELATSQRMVLTTAERRARQNYRQWLRLRSGPTIAR